MSATRFSTSSETLPWPATAFRAKYLPCAPATPCTPRWFPALLKTDPPGNWPMRPSPSLRLHPASRVRLWALLLFRGPRIYFFFELATGADLEFVGGLRAGRGKLPKLELS